MNEEQFEELMNQIRQYIAETYDLTTEVNQNGLLIERAVSMKDSVEVIQSQNHLYILYLN